MLTIMPVAENTFSGPNNSDGGIGVDDAVWNPYNAATLKLSVQTPADFGPEVGAIFPFGDWSLATSTRWVQGQEYTWYPTDYVGTQYPNNMRWKDRWNTNLNLTKTITLRENTKLKLLQQTARLIRHSK